MNPRTPLWKQPQWILVGIVGIALVVGTGVYLTNKIAGLQVDSNQLLSDAKAAFDDMKFAEAVEFGKQLLRREPKNTKALLLVGRSLFRMNKLTDALDHFEKISFDGTDRSLLALERTADIQRVLKQFGPSEDNYRKLLKYSPNSLDVRDRLTYLLINEQRKWEAVPYLAYLMRKKKINVEQLLNLCRIEGVSDNRKELTAIVTGNQDNLIVRVGLARIAFSKNDHATAIEECDRVLAVHPDQIEAIAIKGMCLQQMGKAEFLKWHVELPKSAEAHPAVWFARGAWAEEHGEPKVAIRCYWESSKRWPMFGTSCYRLGQLLVQSGKEKDGKIFIDHSHQLEKLGAAMAPLYTDGPEPRRMFQVANMLTEMGRLWEAMTWHRFNVFFFADHAKKFKCQEAIDALEKRVTDQSPLIMPKFHPALKVDLTKSPLPAWRYVKQSDVATNRQPAQDGETPYFVDESEKLGIRFQYFNDDDPNVDGIQIYQELGGGIGVLDYDQDGWPDIYVTQGSTFTWPPKPDKSGRGDRLYRNLGNGKFADVTAQANLGDEFFGQGVAVADYNNDGFPDLFVANIGKNRLYENQGDGTFREVTLSAGIRGSRWSTSVAIADFNGDTHPDIYVVNYLREGATSPFKLRCVDNRACQPGLFEAAQDRLYVSLGDGRFKDITDASGIVAKEGKGLGIVVADFNGTGRLNMFVANDTTANFYFVNQGNKSSPKFVNRGLLSGLSFDLDGSAQACMGIAFGDTNGDGFFEMFVTNFFNESNTLYSFVKKDRFVDQSRIVGLRRPSYRMLGFGTQFIDGELDGQLDIVVANGHVDDFRDSIGAQYKMRPQYFRNTGGRFDELPSEKVGEYFTQLYLGRSMAKLDWNRDGREDFAVIHLHTPMGVMTNRTKKVGNHLTLHFKGVKSSVDAIGVTATVLIGDKQHVRQLAAGDGFLASNQRMLSFGLGEAKKIDKLVVRWPSGLSEEIPPPPVNGEYVIVEGQGRAVTIPR